MSRHRWSRSFWVALLLGSGAAMAAAAEYEQVRQGKAYLRSGEPGKASEAFEAGIEAARAARDAKAEADLAFYCGLAQQEIGESGDLPREERTRATRKAASRYQAALRIKRELGEPIGSTLNNLAMTWLALGQHERAARCLVEAINLNDARQNLYLSNYASLLEKAGDWKGAIQYYDTVASRGGVEAWEALARLYREHDPSALPAHLRDLIRAGEVLGAHQIALAAIQAASGDAQTTSELLAVLAACLARQRYDPEQFLRGQTARTLAGLNADSPAGRMARELLLLHRSDPRRLNASSFRAWLGRRQPTPADEGQPADDLRDLIRALGDWCALEADRVAKNDRPATRPARDRRVRREPSRRMPSENAQDLLDRAEAYYLLSATLIEPQPDLDAVQACVELYLRHRTREDLTGLTRQLEPVIYPAKAEAYRTQDWRKLYKFHRTLGTIYANLGQLQGDVASAEFQLRRAIDVADRWNATKPALSIVVEPKVVDLLDDVYRQDPRADRLAGTRLRLEMSKKYLELGLPDAARKVIEPVKATTLPADLEIQIGNLKSLLDHAPKQVGTILHVDKVPMMATSQAKQFDVDGRDVSLKLTAPAGSQLNASEVQSIQEEVSRVLREAGPGARSASEPTALHVLSRGSAGARPGSGEGISEVQFDGKTGRVILQKQSGRIEVPFVVEGGQLKTVHVVREGAVGGAP